MTKICVLGLGYIGLPTAAMFAAKGFTVHGVDKKEYIVESVNKGNTHFKEPFLATMVAEAVEKGSLKASSFPAEGDIFIITVPTPITDDKKCDLSFISEAAKSIIPYLRSGNLVILESTVGPGTTQDFLCPLLSTSGLKIGKELFVAHCPERVLPGKIVQELETNNRIIGGVDSLSASKAAELYSSFVKGDIFVTGAATAEMTKLMENTYRDVNIALANELAKIAGKVDVDIWQAINLANKHPRVNIHSPGPGVGGHCIAVDPWFIVEKAPAEAEIIQTARKINDAMPTYVLEIIKKNLLAIEGRKIALLGLSYKGNVGDLRMSPALALAHLLSREGYEVFCHDPHVQTAEAAAVLGEATAGSLRQAVTGASCVVILTDHDSFKRLCPQEIAKIVKNKIIIDTRNLLSLKSWEEEGFTCIKLGSGSRGEKSERNEK